MKEITDTLEKGETVKLSSFGSFIVRKKKQRLGRNPKTGTEATISSRRVDVQTFGDPETADQRQAVRYQDAVKELGSSVPAR